MEPPELLHHVAGCFENLNVPYFVTDGFASIIYGEPRFTNDIDIVADIRENQTAALKACFLEKDFYLEPESVKNAIRRRLQFNIIHKESGLKIDVIFHRHDDFDASRFLRLKRIRSDDKHEANFASPEDVIIKKMDFYRQGKSEKHLRDIAGILKISGDMLDFQYISIWSERFGVEDVWRILRKKFAGK